MMTIVIVKVSTVYVVTACKLSQYTKLNFRFVIKERTFLYAFIKRYRELVCIESFYREHVSFRRLSPNSGSG